MNNLKRILFVTAIIALIASCLALAVGAEYTVDNFDSILEYYEPVFGYETFDDEELGAYTDGIINEWSSKQLTQIVQDGSNKYLTLATTEFPFYSSDLFLDMSAATAERMLLSFKVKGDSLTYGGALPIVSVCVGNNDSGESISFVKLDFNTGKVMYYTNRLRDYIALDGLTLSADTWYSVDIIYNVVDSGYSVSVTNCLDDTQSVYKDDVRTPMGYSTFDNVRIGMTAADIVDGAQGSILSLDDVFAYSGSFYRNPLEVSSQTEQAFADFIGIMDNREVAPEVKIEVLSVYEKIVNELNYVADNAQAQSYVNTLRDYAAMLYVNYVAECTDFIDPNGDYASRRANLDAVVDFYNAIPADYSFLDEEKTARLERVKAAYDTENAALNAIEAECVTFLEAFGDLDFTDFNYEDYPAVNAVYQQVADLTLVDSTYPGVAELADPYKKVILNTEKIVKAGDAFIENVSAYLSATSFDEEYFYYRKAADVKQAYLNDTYPGVAEALSNFNNYVETTDILKLEEDCAGFIQSVNRSDYALYLSEKTKHYEAATPYLSTVYNINGYEIVGVADCVAGVVEAKALYAEVAEYIANATEAATQYIQAVIALEGLTGVELEQAVNNALLLKAEGDIEGFELVQDGVTYKIAEINVILSEISTELSLAKGYCKQFITYVNMVVGADSLTERYTYIRLALAVKPNVDEDFDGVSEAIATLDAEIAAYRSDISGANSSVSGGSAAESSSAVKSRAKNVAPRVVAFVGSYGKED